MGSLTCGRWTLFMVWRRALPALLTLIYKKDLGRAAALS